MTYDFHTTTGLQRVGVMENDFVWKTIKPTDFVQLSPELDRSKTMVWEEGTGRFYELSYQPILDTLEQFKKDISIDYKDTVYYRYWVDVKGERYIDERIAGLKELFTTMKNGFDKNAGLFHGVCVERTGEKLDGSHRATVAHFYGIKEIEVKEFNFNWRSVSWNWLKIKTHARELGLGPNYYYIDYGPFANLQQQVSPIYQENSVERWAIIKDLIAGSVLDLGCNEGYLTINSALQGNKAHGVDYKFIEGAWTNKLIFEKLNKKDIDVSFECADIQDYKIKEKYDTCLLLNVIYHLKEKDKILDEIRKNCKQVIMQGNLRKLMEHNRYYGITAEDMCEMLKKHGFTPRVIEWRDKPIVMGYA